MQNCAVVGARVWRLGTLAMSLTLSACSNPKWAEADKAALSACATSGPDRAAIAGFAGQYELRPWSKQEYSNRAAGVILQNNITDKIGFGDHSISRSTTLTEEDVVGYYLDNSRKRSILYVKSKIVTRIHDSFDSPDRWSDPLVSSNSTCIVTGQFDSGTILFDNFLNLRTLPFVIRVGKDDILVYLDDDPLYQFKYSLRIKGVGFSDVGIDARAMGITEGNAAELLLDPSARTQMRPRSKYVAHIGRKQFDTVLSGPVEATVTVYR